MRQQWARRCWGLPCLVITCCIAVCFTSPGAVCRGVRCVGSSHSLGASSIACQHSCSTTAQDQSSHSMALSRFPCFVSEVLKMLLWMYTCGCHALVFTHAMSVTLSTSCSCRDSGDAAVSVHHRAAATGSPSCSSAQHQARAICSRIRPRHTAAAQLPCGGVCRAGAAGPAAAAAAGAAAGPAGPNTAGINAGACVVRQSTAAAAAAQELDDVTESWAAAAAAASRARGTSWFWWALRWLL